MSGAAAGRHKIATVFMRGGTSNALLFHVDDLPPAGPTRDDFFCRAMGSPDPYGRQLDGMGGGISSLSKVLFLSPPSRPDVDFDYTFGQVAIDQHLVDYAANCGNMTSAMGPFAVDAGYFQAADGPVLVRLFNTNMRQVVHARFMVRDGQTVEAGDLEIPGVGGTGAPIQLDFMANDEAGATPLPSGQVVDGIVDAGGAEVAVSVVNATNVVAFARAADLGLTGAETIAAIENDAALMARLEDLRRRAAVVAGLADSEDNTAAASPKIALVGPPAPFTALDGRQYPAAAVDLSARVLSMGNVHRAIPLTAAMCTAAAAAISGSTVHGARQAAGDAAGELRIGTPSGVVKAAAEVTHIDGQWQVPRTSTFRTARRLMAGWVHG
ncbi:MAG: PrpF domain-containing protein [Pseudomonadota bacterium]|nr:PrpF domain-containing protein [Pseudomonadota bacterium]